jgi:DNA polymerase-3 subunit delta'
MLQLDPLGADQVSQAVMALGDPWSSLGSEIAAAAHRAGGSVKQALRYLDKDRFELAESVEGLLSRLPLVDWQGVHRLADRIAGSAAVDDFDAVVGALFDWLDSQVHLGAQAGEGADRLAPYAEVWEKVADAVREAEALNLDKRPLVLSIFADLAAAVRAARS